MQLTGDSLLVQRKSNEKYLLYIYGTKCGICNKIKLNIIDGLKTLEEKEIEANFYAITIDYFQDEILELGIWKESDGVPSFVYFDGAELLFEINPRHAEDFVKFFENPIAPKQKKLDPDWSLQESAQD